MNCIEALAIEGRILCPDSNSPLIIKDAHLFSGQSGRDFGSIEGPLNFLTSVEIKLTPSGIPVGEIEKIRTHLALPTKPEIDAKIAIAIAATSTELNDPHLSAESKLLTERFKIASFSFDAEAPATETFFERVSSAVSKRLAGKPRLERGLTCISHSIGEHLTVGQEVYRSIRVRNTGSATLLPSGDDAVGLLVCWSGLDGAPCPGFDLLNELPVDICPGREITLILRVRPPVDTGQFKLSVHLSVNNTKSEPFFTTSVEMIPCELPVFEYDYFPKILGYEEDHRVAVLEMVNHLNHVHSNNSALILEIGGGVHPTGHAVSAAGHRVISCDISHAQSILGSLYFKHHHPELDERLAFITGEGTKLPFQDATFDSVMLYSSFHHFADPVGLLEEAKRITNADGFIFLGCDNCVPSPKDLVYKDELNRGINEQMWPLSEMARFFRKANLKVARARVDFHSLKVVLVKQ